MKTDPKLSRRLESLATLTEDVVNEAILNLQLADQPGNDGAAIAGQLRDDAKSFVFALRDAIGVLAPELIR